MIDFKRVPIAVDFDGTCVTHEYPKVGRSIGAEAVLKELHSLGALFVLNTMRSGDALAEAVSWFDTRQIPLYGVNKNPDQDSWTKSPKVFAQIYIDDAALGAPLQKGKPGERPYIDWAQVRVLLGLAEAV